jgi:hypothetical protein
VDVCAFFASFAAGDDALRRVVERAAPFAALTALRVTFLRVGPFEPAPDAAAATTRDAANAAHEGDAIFE